jgi:hypothetical protein
MRKLHPRLGMLEVIEESPLFYRVSTSYDFWVPKADFTEPKPPKGVPKKKLLKKMGAAKGETIDVTVEHPIPPQDQVERMAKGFKSLALRIHGAVGAYTVSEDGVWKNVVQFDDPSLAAMFAKALQKAGFGTLTLHVKPYVN